MAGAAPARAAQIRQPARESDADVSARLQDPAARRAAAAELLRATANLQRGLARGRRAEPGQVAALQSAINFYTGRKLLEVDDKFGAHTERILDDVQAILKRDPRVGDRTNIGGGRAAAPTINGLVAALTSDEPAANADAFARVRAQPNVRNPFGSAATAPPSAVIRPAPAEPSTVAGDRRTEPKPEDAALAAARTITASSARSPDYQPADGESATALRTAMEPLAADQEARRRALDGIAADVGRQPSAARPTAARSLLTALSSADGAELYDRIKPSTDGRPARPEDRQRLTPEQHLRLAHSLIDNGAGSSVRGQATESLGGMPDNAVTGLHDALRARAATPQRTHADLDAAADLRAELLRRRGDTPDLGTEQGRRDFDSDARFAFGAPGAGTGDATDGVDRDIAARITDPEVQASLRDTVLKRLESTTPPPQGADVQDIARYRLQLASALRGIPNEGLPADMQDRVRRLQERVNPPVDPAVAASPAVNLAAGLRSADPQRITRNSDLAANLDVLRARNPAAYQSAITRIAADVAGNTRNRADQVRDIFASVSREHIGELYPKLNLTPDETRRLATGLMSSNVGGVPGAPNPDLDKLPPAVLQRFNDTFVERARAWGASTADRQAAASTAAALYRARANEPYTNDAAGRARLESDARLAFGPPLRPAWLLGGQPDDPAHHGMGESARHAIQTQFIDRLTAQVGDQANPQVLRALESAAPPQNATPAITEAYNRLVERARNGAPRAVAPPAERREPDVAVTEPRRTEPLTTDRLLELASTTPDQLTAEQRLELGKVLGDRTSRYGVAATGNHPYDSMAPATLRSLYDSFRAAGPEGRDPAVMARLAMMRRGIQPGADRTIADDAAWAFGPAANRNDVLGHIGNPEARIRVDALFRQAQLAHLDERAAALAAAGDRASPEERALIARAASTVRANVPPDAAETVRGVLAKVDANLARVPERPAAAPRPAADDPAAMARAIRPGNEGVADARALAQRLEQLRTAQGGDQRYRAAITSVADALRPPPGEQDAAAVERRSRLARVMLANDNVARDLHTAIGGNDTPARQRDLVELGRAYAAARPQTGPADQPLQGIPDNVLDSVSNAMMAAMPPRDAATTMRSEDVVAAMRVRWERFRRDRRDDTVSNTAFAFDTRTTAPGSDPSRAEPTFRGLSETYARTLGSDADREAARQFTAAGEQEAQRVMGERLERLIGRHTETDRAHLRGAATVLPPTHALQPRIAAEVNNAPTLEQLTQRVADLQRRSTPAAAQELQRLYGQEGERIVPRGAGPADAERLQAWQTANPTAARALIDQMSPADRVRVGVAVASRGDNGAGFDALDPHIATKINTALLAPPTPHDRGSPGAQAALASQLAMFRRGLDTRSSDGLDVAQTTRFAFDRPGSGTHQSPTFTELATNAGLAPDQRAALQRTLQQQAVERLERVAANLRNPSAPDRAQHLSKLRDAIGAFGANPSVLDPALADRIATMRRDAEPVAPAPEARPVATGEPTAAEIAAMRARLARLPTHGNLRELPAESEFYTTYAPEGVPQRYATPRTLAMLQMAAELYYRRTGEKMRIGDIAARPGTPLRGHRSHSDGNIFDIDMGFNDGRASVEPQRGAPNARWGRMEGRTPVYNPAYSRELTRELIRAVRDLDPNVNILFNDPVLVAAGQTRRFDNHDNHLHVQGRWR